MSEYRIAGYVKLAKLWERSRDEAISFHVDYYKSKFENNSEMTLQGVYIDITGNKETWKRPNMVRLLRDCATNKIDCIATQTKAYLAANTEEFFFVLFFLFSLPNRIDIITEDADYNINTIENKESQREALFAAAQKYISVEPARYQEWLKAINDKMESLND